MNRYWYSLVVLVIFIGLKISGELDWSWGMVMIPFWAILISYAAVIIAGIVGFFKGFAELERTLEDEN